MNEVVLFKGKYEIIILPEFSSKAEKLYNFLKTFFESKSFKLKFVESKPDYLVSNKLSKDIQYIIGHSRGANKILKEFNPKKFPNIKGVMLFDPLNCFKDNWNRLAIHKILFGSNWGQNYSKFRGAIQIQDDHYFNNSLEEIKKNIIQFLN